MKYSRWAIFILWYGLAIHDHILYGQDQPNSSETFIQTRGEVEYSYLHGYAWEYANAGFPADINTFSGRFDVTLGGLMPIQTSWHLSNYPYLNGSPNTFSISLNMEELKKNLLKHNSLQSYQNVADLDKLNSELDSLLSIKRYHMFRQSEVQNSLDHLDIPNTISIGEVGYDENVAEHLAMQDSLQMDIDQHQHTIDQLSALAQELSDKVQWLEQMNDNAIPENPDTQIKGAGLMNILQAVKRLDIGSFEPSRSALHTQGVPMRGFQLELDNEKFYALVAHGKTVKRFRNTWSPNTQDQSNVLNDIDLFHTDGNNAPGKVTIYRVGTGSTNSTHLHVGLLHGNEELLPTENARSTYDEKNIAAHADIKYEIDRHRSISGSYARSYTWVDERAQEGSNDSLGILDHLFKDEGNDAFALKFDGRFPKTKTKVAMEMLRVGPLYNSMAVAFLRKDQQRYKGVLAQGIGRKFNSRWIYRRTDYKPQGSGTNVNVQTIILRLRYKLNKKTKVMLLGSFGTQDVTSSENIGDGHSNTSSLGADVVRRWRKRNDQFILIAGYSSYWMVHPSSTTRSDQIRANFTWLVDGRGSLNASFITNAISDTSDAVVAKMRAQFSVNLDYKLIERLSVISTVMLYEFDKYRISGNLGLNWNIFKNFNWAITCSIRPKGEIFTQLEVAGEQDLLYTCSSRLIYRW